MLAAQADTLSADLLVIHDPQPAAVPGFLHHAPSRGAIWRAHIDLSQPNPDALTFLAPLLRVYRLIILEVSEYRLPGIPDRCQSIIHDAIDPLTRKNRLIRRETALRIMAQVGMNPSWPTISQIARFDPWKNPIGVVDAYRKARRTIPNLQLAMLGTFVAQDDPTAEQEYEEVKCYVGDDPLVHLFTDPTIIGQPEVGAFQTGSDAVLLFSFRESFGFVGMAACRRLPMPRSNCWSLEARGGRK